MDPISQAGTPEPPVVRPPSVVGYCRECGKGLTRESVRPALGTLFCEEHAPVAAGAGADAGSPYAPAKASGVSPALAWILGFFVPGLGAIYNAQYAKGFIHVLIFGLLVSLLNSDAVTGFEPLFGTLLAGFVFYQAFEAYHTAKRRERGQPVPEFSSILDSRASTPLAPLAMIALGVLFLLANLGWLRLSQILRYWPVALIGLGVFLLYQRTKGDPADAE